MASSVTVQGGVVAAAGASQGKSAARWWSDRRVLAGAVAVVGATAAWALWPRAASEQVVDREDLATACAAKKDAAACLALGERTWTAPDGGRDLAAAERALQAACDAGEPRGCVRLAHLYEDVPAFDAKKPAAADLRRRAATAYEKPCEAQDPYACLSLAALTVTGKGVTKSTSRAAQLYAQARPLLEAQCADATTPAVARRRNCGAASLMAWRGLGGAKDPARSFELLEQACTLGDVASCMLAAATYADGAGAREATAEPAKAPAMFKKACDLGEPRACHALAKLTRAANLPDAQALATKACDAGVAGACQDIGQMTFSGEGGPSDPKKAKEWFLREVSLRQKACDAGVGEECVELAANYRSRGQGVPIDAAKAAELDARALAAWQAGCDAAVWSECLALRTRLEKEPTPDLKRVRALRERECALGYEHTCRRLGVGYPPPRP